MLIVNIPSAITAVLACAPSLTTEGALDLLQDKKPTTRKRRLATEIDRVWRCKFEGCTKSYGSEGAMRMHHRLKHVASTSDKSDSMLAMPNAVHYFHSDPNSYSQTMPYTEHQLRLQQLQLQHGSVLHAILPHPTPPAPLQPLPQLAVSDTTTSAVPIQSRTAATAVSQSNYYSATPPIPPASVSTQLPPLPHQYSTSQSNTSTNSNSNSTSGSSGGASGGGCVGGNTNAKASNGINHRALLSARPVTIAPSVSIMTPLQPQDLYQRTIDAAHAVHRHSPPIWIPPKAQPASPVRINAVQSSRRPVEIAPAPKRPARVHTFGRPSGNDVTVNYPENLETIKLVSLQLGKWTQCDVELVIDFESRLFHYFCLSGLQSWDIIVDFRSLSSIFIEHTRDGSSVLMSYHLTASPRFRRNHVHCCDFTNTNGVYYTFHSAQFAPSINIAALTGSLRFDAHLAKLLELQVSVSAVPGTDAGSWTQHVAHVLSQPGSSAASSPSSTTSSSSSATSSSLTTAHSYGRTSDLHNYQQIASHTSNHSMHSPMAHLSSSTRSCDYSEHSPDQSSSIVELDSGTAAMRAPSPTSSDVHSINSPESSNTSPTYWIPQDPSPYAIEQPGQYLRHSGEYQMHHHHQQQQHQQHDSSPDLTSSLEDQGYTLCAAMNCSTNLSTSMEFLLPCGHASMMVASLLYTGACCPTCHQEYYYSLCKRLISSAADTRHCPNCNICVSQSESCRCTRSATNSPAS
jgi:hypothetical protein